MAKKDSLKVISQFTFWVQLFLAGYILAMATWGNKTCVIGKAWFENSCTYIPGIEISIWWIGFIFLIMVAINHLATRDLEGAKNA